MKSSETRISLVGLLIACVASGCGREETPTTENSKQTIEIECHFFYRPNTGTAESEAKNVTIKVPFLTGDIPEIALDISEKAEFENLSCGLSAHYNVLNVHFFDSEHTLSAILYQFAEIPENGMAGGHGFTGLHYIYHPGSEAELQFWAEVKEPGDSETEE